MRFQGPVKIFTLFAVVFPLVANADPVGWPKNMLSGVDASAKLPTTAMHLVESQGRVILMSTNGHYAIVDGKIMDMWNAFEIRSVADVERSMHIPLKRMGLGTEDMSGVTIGTGSYGPVTVFLDPASPETPKILPIMQSLYSQYQFNVVFVPAQASRKKSSQALICSSEAATEFMTTGRVAGGLRPEEGCGNQKLKQNIMVMQLLGIDILPFTIAPNGKPAVGIPKNYGEYLAANLE